eukprot:CAMPEP_0185732120 /NCGR_PEP_ID=MMETSP1171-20130828/15092_1 /TAXON_ID=374046 /ORGANISM="Helicotheca tamensis, Strain CCMP826" /LENGTH=201 /DNA_ID=CAMNT_0028401531 /DNA_START=25 /DNA_END=630 /DNA_ORIENTATION=-
MASSIDAQSISVTLPQWAIDQSSSFYNKNYETDEDMMKLAINLSSQNIKHNTGGPFGCAIFSRNLQTKEATLISIGVNRVVPLNNSTLHGETVAIQFAQQKIGRFSLSDPRVEKTIQYELFTSCEPCAMCLGAILWSGVSRVVCAAAKDDAAAIGFDEGPVFEASYQHLRDAGVEVKRLVLKDEAALVLKKYGETGVIYNG